MITLKQVSEYLKAIHEAHKAGQALKNLPRYQELYKKVTAAKKLQKEIAGRLVDDQNHLTHEVRRLLELTFDKVDVPAYDYTKVNVSPNTDKLLKEPISAVIDDIIRYGCKADPTALRKQLRGDILKKLVKTSKAA